MKRYNLVYLYDGQEKIYNSFPMDTLTAGACLEMFERNYINSAGGGKIYPNGEGFYPIDKYFLCEV